MPPDEHALSNGALPSNMTLESGAAIDPLLTERAAAVRQSWPRKTASPVVKMVHRLWEHAIHHGTPNLFHTTEPQSCEEGDHSRWHMDANCRDRLIRDCQDKFLSVEKYTGGVTAPGSPCITMATAEDTEMEGLSPHSGRSRFPSVETLEMSLDFFFRRSHPVIPFIHKPTFDSRATPSPLLFGLCLTGLSGLNPSGGKDFILQHIGGLMRYCRLDLTYKALGKTGAQPLLTSLASALVVLFLCLDLGGLVDVHQAHMLAVQTLFIADRHGLFRAKEAKALNEAMFGIRNDQYWLAWARVESLKRLISCLIIIDSAITRTLDLAAIMGLDHVEVMLGCSPRLFECANASTFFHSLQTPVMPIIELSRFEVTRSDDFSCRMQLAFLSLCEAAARHHKTDLSSVHFVPAKIYERDYKSGQLMQSLISLVPRSGQPHAAIQWHYLCLLLSVDMNSVHIACGKDGISASRKALSNLQQWATTAAARRAVLHTSEIHNLSTRHRVSEDKTLCHESMLATVAMVHALFVLLQPDVDVSILDGELDADWSSIGHAGLTDGIEEHRTVVGNVGKDFILQQQADPDRNRHPPGPARRLLFNYAQVLDEVNSPQANEYSRLLRSIADFFSALDV